MTSDDTLLHEVFDWRAGASGSRLSIREPGRDWSYAELRARAGAIADNLCEAGIESGRRVALMLPNSGALVAGFLGIVRAGGVVAPFNARYREQELGYYLNDTGATALLASPDVAGLAEAAAARLPHPPAILEIDPAGLCRARSRGIPCPHSSKCGQGGDAALLHQYTSGSTGAPKRIIRTHRQLLRELESLAAVFDLTEQDRFLGAAPFSHVNGMVRTMLAALFAGGTLYPVPEFKRREILELIRVERITCFGGVPYMFVVLADTPAQGAVDLSSLRIVFSASAPLRPEDNRRFAAKYGLFVRQLYGSTETGTISVNRHDDPARCLESVGLPLDGVRVEILDDEGRALPDGEEGEVAIASPTAIAAYDGNPEANAASFKDGFYRSGDLGRKNPDGCLVLTGRKKFLINRGGYKVNPLEVEQAILSHPSVKEVVVLGAPTRYGDEAVRCVIVPAGPCRAEDILQHCRSRIADFKIPSLVEFRDELPKSETGKVLRQKL